MYHISYIIHHTSYIVYRISYVAYHMSCITYRISHIAYCISHIAYRISYIAYLTYRISTSSAYPISDIVSYIQFTAYLVCYIALKCDRCFCEFGVSYCCKSDYFWGPRGGFGMSWGPLWPSLEAPGWPLQNHWVSRGVSWWSRRPPMVLHAAPWHPRDRFVEPSGVAWIA